MRYATACASTPRAGRIAGRGEMVTNRDAELDAVAAADALLVEDPVEQRLLLAYRAAPIRARLAVVELIEELAMQRTGRPRPVARTARGVDAQAVA